PSPTASQTVIDRLSESSQGMRNAVWRSSHTVTDSFRVLSKVMYNSRLVKISMKYLLVEVLYSKVRNNAEAYPGMHKKTSFQGINNNGYIVFHILIPQGLR